MTMIGLEGALMTLSPLPVLFALTGVSHCQWRIWLALLSAAACFICALTLFRYQTVGRLVGGFSVAACFGSALPVIIENPFFALVSFAIVISVGFMLFDFRIAFKKEETSDHPGRCLRRAKWALLSLPALVLVDIFLGTSGSNFSGIVIAVSLLISLLIFSQWVFAGGSYFRMSLPLAGTVLFCILFFSTGYISVPVTALVLSFLGFIVLPRCGDSVDGWEYWRDVLLNHPARALLVTFLALCVTGTFLLGIPASATNAISIVDAAFTSVSAVCVTGLIVLDTPNDFSMLGQLFILILIQLGGLGIMSITTVALYAMGRRISLKQERVLTTIADTDHKGLTASILTILKFTFIAEAIGFVFLTLLFTSEGDNIAQALWRGIFTAVSALCNAGFALQSDSLIPYQNNPGVLAVVSALIVAGGMAPATSLVIPRWIRGKSVPVAAKIALVTTLVLLILGTFFFLAFEWNGVLKGLPAGGKVLNAWFQSATLRTAGFNSVGISAVSGPSFLVMILFMFIGGSPGGTAGGIKTTTIGVIAMTFWANITGRNVVVAQKRRIRTASVYRAVTIVAAGLIVWFLAVLMLQTTQQISAGDILFEATSALATVGLSTGGTAMLDEVGKIIIMITMFAGRVGPVTLFMLLSRDDSQPASRCPEVDISLT